MRATSILLATCVSLTITSLANEATASISASMRSRLIQLSAIGQLSLPSTSKSDDRRKSDDLLRRARQEIQDENYRLAESLIDRAEKLGVSYDGIFRRHYYTPEKARRDLAKATGTGDQKSLLPSKNFLPSILNKSKNQDSKKEDPFNNQDRGAALNSMTNTGKAAADDYLARGRKALAAGDLLSAKNWYQKASAENAQYSSTEYSPAQLAAELQKAGIKESDLRAPASRFSSQTQNSQGSGFGQNRAITNPFSSGNQSLTAGRSGTNALSGSKYPFPSTQQNSRFSEIKPTGANTALVDDKQFGKSLLLDARRALANQNIELANSFVKQARELNLTYQLDEDSPAKVGSLIQKASQLNPNDRSNPAYLALLLQQSEELLRYQDYQSAQDLALRAQSLGIQPGPFQQTPGQLLERIVTEQKNNFEKINLAGNTLNTQSPNENAYPVKTSLYIPEQDNTRVTTASANQPVNSNRRTTSLIGGYDNNGMQLFRQGETALQNRDSKKAYQLFQEAWNYEAQLEPNARKKTQTYLQQLRLAQNVPPSLPSQNNSTNLDQVTAEQQALMQQAFSKVNYELSSARKMQEKDPNGALNRLRSLRQEISQSSDIQAPARKQLLTRIDRSINDLGNYIDNHRSEIDLDKRNAQIRSEIDREQQVKLVIQEAIQDFVKEFNQLMDEERFAEAEALARRAQDIDPNSIEVQTMLRKSIFAKRSRSIQNINEQAESGFNLAIESIEQSRIPYDDRNPITFPSIHEWDQLTKDRRRLIDGQRRKLGPGEAVIRAALKRKVDVKFSKTPLSEVINRLQDMAGVNIFIDEAALIAEEGVTLSEPITVPLTHPISLESALNLILQPLNLGFIIQDEVIKITTEQTQNTETYAETYYVADLIIPIPNFIPSPDQGLAGGLRAAYETAFNYGNPGNSGMSPIGLLANQGRRGSTPSANVLAQMGSESMSSSLRSELPPHAYGPGGLGGGAQADFDSLIDLIMTTVSSTSWEENGGTPGNNILEHEPTLSIVVSTTPEIHREIVDLLEQLRRLQDLQITIEVRFITLSDNFFERIGIDFDFDIDDNVDPADPAATGDVDGGPSVTIGLDPMGMPTADLDLQFTQGSFDAAVPQFGGFDAGSAANFGFAVLSEIEAFFVIQAASGDQRTNVLQAPKVTLFNGQNATIQDVVNTPFVTGLIPVVGDFAAAHQPVVAVLSEGTSLSVQAVVSSDRRFIRLTVVPLFTRIGEVNEFTFEGSTTTNTGTAAVDPSDPDATVNNEEQTVTEGSTVQLPQLSTVSVSTTVSVPDGGTVLLGGIKRLSEGRTERTVPLLGKLPYINRLFRNTGIGRETSTLMMMVTPRIIIQEEEENNLGLGSSP